MSRAKVVLVVCKGLLACKDQAAGVANGKIGLKRVLLIFWPVHDLTTKSSFPLISWLTAMKPKFWNLEVVDIADI